MTERKSTVAATKKLEAQILVDLKYIVTTLALLAKQTKKTLKNNK